MKHTTSQKGFTMIEMIVVLGIFAVVSGVVLFNYSKFRSTTILTNMAYEVALSIREAQIYGVSVRGPQGSTPTFSQAYGVHFSNSITNQYLLFSDGNGDGLYDGDTCDNPGEDICITPYTLLGNITITEVLVCPLNEVSLTNGLNIVYQRPNPEPLINGSRSVTRARITVTSPDGEDNRYIVVYNNGQISVVNEPQACN